MKKRQMTTQPAQHAIATHAASVSSSCASEEVLRCAGGSFVSFFFLHLHLVCLGQRSSTTIGINRIRIFCRRSRQTPTTMLPSTRKLVAAMAVLLRLLLPAAFAWPASTFLTNLSLCATPFVAAANLVDIGPPFGFDPANVTMVSRGVIMFHLNLLYLCMHMNMTRYL